MQVNPSARKHGFSDEDIRHAGTRFLVAYPQDEEVGDGPRRELRLGPDRAGNLVEVVVLIFDDNRELAIHAMRMRPSYRRLLPRPSGGTR